MTYILLIWPLYVSCLQIRISHPRTPPLNSITIDPTTSSPKTLVGTVLTPDHSSPLFNGVILTHNPHLELITLCIYTQLFCCVLSKRMAPPSIQLHTRSPKVTFDPSLSFIPLTTFVDKTCQLYLWKASQHIPSLHLCCHDLSCSYCHLFPGQPLCRILTGFPVSALSSLISSSPHNSISNLLWFCPFLPPDNILLTSVYI